MNARSVEDVLDRLAPREQFAHDWGGVLDRAGVHEAGAVGPAWRRRKWLLLAAVVAAVLVPVAAATVAATNDWWLFHADHGLHPVTEPVVVQTGTWDGKRWQLVASRFAGNGIVGLLLQRHALRVAACSEQWGRRRLRRIHHPARRRSSRTGGHQLRFR